VKPLADCHMILMPETRRDWQQNCVDSAEREPLNLHYVWGVEGHIGLGRYEGFTHGTLPYVTFVDPDDRLEPGALELCVEALEENPQAAVAYPAEAVMGPTGQVHYERPLEWYQSQHGTRHETHAAHHGVVYRRGPVLKHLWACGRSHSIPEFSLNRALYEHYEFIFVPVIGYTWRKHDRGAGRSIRKEYEHEYRDYRRWLDGVD
jgi:hypothetical protein